MDDKSNLQQLSKCLNNAGNVINTILENDNPLEQHGTTTKPVSWERGPQEAKNQQSARATMISLAVERASLMIGESSSRGLCSRLNSRERLWATSSKSCGTTAKKPWLEKKIFEFVLLWNENLHGKTTPSQSRTQ